MVALTSTVLSLPSEQSTERGLVVMVMTSGSRATSSCAEATCFTFGPLEKLQVYFPVGNKVCQKWEGVVGGVAGGGWEGVWWGGGRGVRVSYT